MIHYLSRHALASAGARGNGKMKNPKKDDGYITLQEAATTLGYNPHYFRRLCKRGLIRATQIKSHFFFSAWNIKIAKEELALHHRGWRKSEGGATAAGSGGDNIFDGL